MNGIDTPPPLQTSKELVVYYRNFSQAEPVDPWRFAIGLLYDFITFAIAHIADPLILHRFDDNPIIYNGIRSLIVTLAQLL